MSKNLKDQNRKPIPISELDVIYERIEEGRKGVEMKKEEGSIKMESGAKELKIHKDGKLKGSMPLHSFETLNAEELVIRDDEIEVRFEDGKYVFRI